MRKIIILLSVIFVICAIACAAMAEGGSVMKLKSPEFNNNEFIPKKFTCRGENINPELTIEDTPIGARSLAIIMDDPDAPGGNWVHWVMFGVPVVSKIEEDSAPGKQGVNDSGRRRYDGPCPPFGTHRYIFKAYALDTELNLEEGVTKADLEKAMESHILAKSELIGLYKK